MSWREEHCLLRIWTAHHETFVECGCGWCTPRSSTQDQALTWWEQHARQMRKQAETPLREAFREVLALHGRVALDDLEDILTELVAVAAQTPSPEPGLSVSTRVTGDAQNAAQAPIR